MYISAIMSPNHLWSDGAQAEYCVIPKETGSRVTNDCLYPDPFM